MDEEYAIDKVVNEKGHLGTWNTRKGDFEETPEDIINFLKDIEDVCKKHNMSILHEDSQGGFEIDEFDKYNLEWLANASDIRGNISKER